MDADAAGAAGGMPFSFSRLKAFEQCPLRYRFKYLQQLREAFRSLESQLGTVMHVVLEWLYTERERHQEPTVAAALEYLDACWHEEWDELVAVVRVEQRPEDCLLLARGMLERFHERVFARDESVTLALERRLNLDLSERLTFTGFADRIGRTRAGRLFVVDYKTSRLEGDGSDLSSGMQAQLYATAAMAEYGDSAAVAGYHYLRPGTTHWEEMTPERGRRLALRFAEKAAAALAATDHPARPTALCAWCGYCAVCPAAEVPDHLGGGRRFALARQTLQPA